MKKVIENIRVGLLFRRYFRKYSCQKNAAGKKILIYAGIGSMYLTPLEILFYHLFRFRGFNVDYYIYNSDNKINEVLTKDRAEKYGIDRYWSRSVKWATLKLKLARVDYKIIDANSRANQIIEAESWTLNKVLSYKVDDIDFGNIVYASLCRYYQSTTFDDSAINIAVRFLHTSLVNYFQISSLVQKNRYQAILFSHGINCTWGPLAQYLEKEGLDYYCYDRAKMSQTININKNHPSPVWDISTAWQRYSGRDLNEEEQLKVSNYLEERILQKNDVFAYNTTGKVTDLTRLKETLGIPKESIVITFFTNLIWDAANVARDIAFDSPLDCIVKVIHKYSNQHGIHLLIRTHPAEIVLGTKERYSDLIKTTINSFPENLTIIEAEDDINSFTVIDLTDIGIVHTSTVGLEMAVAGKPVLLISDTHYRNKGFTTDCCTEEEFFEKLDSAIQLKGNQEVRADLARKYFYLMMFEYQQSVPIHYQNNRFIKYNHASFADLTNDKDCEINSIADEIIAGAPKGDFLKW